MRYLTLLLGLSLSCAAAPPLNPDTAALLGTARHGFYCGATWIGPHTLLTAAHCIQHQELAVTFRDGLADVATVECIDTVADIALLHTETRAPAVAPLRQDPIPDGTEVQTTGAPYGRPWGSARGDVLGRMPAGLALRMRILPGHSGGGVLDMSGNVVGVVISRIPDRPLGFAAPVGIPSVCHIAQ